MKIQGLATALLASTAFAKPSTDPRDEVNCTHLVLGMPKSRTTAVAQALCHAMQKDENTSCIHEPFRVAQERDIFYPKRRLPQYRLQKANLCKDMLYHIEQSADGFNAKIKGAIKATDNSVVFLKSDPKRSLLSLIDLALKQMSQRYGNLKNRLKSDPSVGNYLVHSIKERAMIVVQNSVALTEMKIYAHFFKKNVVELEEGAFSKNPSAELNKALSSWNKKSIPENQPIKLAPKLYLEGKKASPKQTPSNSYQFAIEDTWDTSTGEVFDPSIGNLSNEEKLQAMLDKYVPEEMHDSLKKQIHSVFEVLDDAVVIADKDYKKLKAAADVFHESEVKKSEL